MASPLNLTDFLKAKAMGANPLAMYGDTALPQSLDMASLAQTSDQGDPAANVAPQALNRQIADAANASVQAPPPQEPPQSSPRVGQVPAPYAGIDKSKLDDYISSRSDQRSSIDALKAQLAAYSKMQGGQTDLSPLMALSDAWFGGNQSKNYKAPETADQRLEKMAGLQDKIAQRQNDLSKEATTAMDVQVKQDANNVNKQYVQNQKETAAEARQTAADEKAKNSAFLQTGTLLESMRGSPAVQQAEKDLYSVGKINKLATLYGDPNKLDPTMVSILRGELGKVATGQVPTMEALKELDPGTLTGALSGVYQKFKNEPTAANAGAFISGWQKYANSVAKDAQGLITDRYGRIIESRKNKLNSGDYDTLKSNYIDRFKNVPIENSPAQTEIMTTPQGKFEVDHTTQKVLRRVE